MTREKEGYRDNIEQLNQLYPSHEKLTLSIPEAAKRIGISDTSMRQLARTVGFPAFQVGSRLLISAKGLEKWVDEQAQKGI